MLGTMPRRKPVPALETDPRLVPKVHLTAEWILSTLIQTRLTLAEVEAIATGARPADVNEAFWSILRADCQRFLPELKGDVAKSA